MTAIDTYTTNTPNLFITKLNDNEEELEIKFNKSPKKFLLKDFNNKNNSFIVKSDSTNTLCNKDEILQPLGIVWSVSNEQGYRKRMVKKPIYMKDAKISIGQEEMIMLLKETIQ